MKDRANEDGKNIKNLKCAYCEAEYRRHEGKGLCRMKSHVGMNEGLVVGVPVLGVQVLVGTGMTLASANG